VLLGVGVVGWLLMCCILVLYDVLVVRFWWNCGAIMIDLLQLYIYETPNWVINSGFQFAKTYLLLFHSGVYTFSRLLYEILH
jgi:hypothetical protein